MGLFKLLLKTRRFQVPEQGASSLLIFFDFQHLTGYFCASLLRIGLDGVIVKKQLDIK